MPKIVTKFLSLKHSSPDFYFSGTDTYGFPTSNKTSENIEVSITMIFSVLQRDLQYCREITQE